MTGRVENEPLPVKRGSSETRGYWTSNLEFVMTSSSVLLARPQVLAAARGREKKGLKRAAREVRRCMGGSVSSRSP